MTKSTEQQLNETITLALKEVHGEFLRFLVRRTASKEDAEDIFQDFCLKVLRNAQTIRTPGSLRSWLAQVLRRTLTDHYRKSAVKRRAQQRLEIEPEFAMSDDEAERAICSCLDQVLPALLPRYAEVIRRVDLLGEPRSQVAKSLDISANNMRVRLYRARQALRASLEKFCVTCPKHGFLNCACKEAKERATVQRRSRSLPAKSVMK